MTAVERLVANGNAIIKFLKDFVSSEPKDVSIKWINDDESEEVSTFANIKKFQDSVGMYNDGGIIKDLEGKIIKMDFAFYDTRNENPTPLELTQKYNLNAEKKSFIKEFKYSSIIGVDGAETYGTLLSIRRWSSNEDWTGGGIDQIFLSNGKMWTRTGEGDSWGAWREL